jgi:cytochrome c-type biogenesis protein CcmH
MIAFWILAAGLAVLGALFVVAPLLTKREAEPAVDQDRLNLEVFRQQIKELEADLEAGNLDKAQYNAARRDLERELLYDVNGSPGAEASAAGGRSPLIALMLGLAVPAFAVGLYFALGESSIIPRLEMAATAQGIQTGHDGGAGGQPLPSMDALVERLAARMEQSPENLDGWLMLGRSYFAINKPAQALAALDKAYALAPDNPEVILAYAQAVAANAEGKLVGRPAELIATALELDPSSVTGRWLEGLVVYQAGDFDGAVGRWEAILAELDPASEEAAEMREFIADARERADEASKAAPADAGPADAAALGAAGTPQPPPSQGASDAAAAEAEPGTPAGAKLTVNVRLAEPLWKDANVDHTLFVYARAVSGPPMPLAVKRLRTGDLPVTVTLDDSMAMMPAMRLSAFPEVTVGARISASGQATPASGDLEGEVGPVAPGATSPVDLVIDRVRP